MNSMFSMFIYNIGGKFHGIIKSMYDNAKSCVKLPGGVTQSLKLEKGINEGDTLSPYLLNLYLNYIKFLLVRNVVHL